MEENNVPGKGAAIASLVLGIVSIACWAIFGATLWANIVAVVCGVVGLILAINAKKAGFTGGLGILLLRKTMDDLSYRRAHGCNILSFRKIFA